MRFESFMYARMKIASPKCDFRPTPNLLSHSAHLHCDTPCGQAVPAQVSLRGCFAMAMPSRLWACLAYFCDAWDLPALLKDVARYPIPQGRFAVAPVLWVPFGR